MRRVQEFTNASVLKADEDIASGSIADALEVTGDESVDALQEAGLRKVSWSRYADLAAKRGVQEGHLAQR